MAGTSSHDDLRFSRLAKWLCEGDASAEALIVRRFTVQLVALARRQMAQRIRQKSGPEDVVQSAFLSFFRRLRQGQFQFGSWDGLWSLLVLITVRKCSGRREHFFAARRDVRRETPLSTDFGDRAAIVPLARDPRPEEALALTELVEQLLLHFSGSEQQIVHLRLQGYSIGEICDKLGRADRTVRRVLARVRRKALCLTNLDDEDLLSQSPCGAE
jgi:RNA polymerase sigma-70 factor, ECF subfamily